MTPEHQRCCHLPSWVVVVVLRVWQSVLVYALGRCMALWLGDRLGPNSFLGTRTHLASSVWRHAETLDVFPRLRLCHLG